MTTETRKGDWIQTNQGKRFYPLDPRPEDVDIVDIAHALSMQCRYGGHAKTFYSVAEHCIILADCVMMGIGNIEHAFAALMHDAAEAYILDLPRPIKGMLPGYVEMESKIEAVIFEKFGVKQESLAFIKDWDRAILMDERKHLFKDPLPWGTDCEPLGINLHYLSRERAFGAFMARFETLVEMRESHERWKMGS